MVEVLRAEVNCSVSLAENSGAMICASLPRHRVSMHPGRGVQFAGVSQFQAARIAP